MSMPKSVRKRLWIAFVKAPLYKTFCPWRLRELREQASLLDWSDMPGISPEARERTIAARRIRERIIAAKRESTEVKRAT